MLTQLLRLPLRLTSDDLMIYLPSVPALHFGNPEPKAPTVGRLPRIARSFERYMGWSTWSGAQELSNWKNGTRRWGTTTEMLRRALPSW